jgi:hypothetical protein
MNNANNPPPSAISEASAITPTLTDSQYTDDFVFNFTRSKLINLLCEKVDVDNDSRVFVTTLLLIQFIPDRILREVVTNNFLNDCKDKDGTLQTSFDKTATKCVLLSGVIYDCFHASKSSANLIAEIDNDLDGEKFDDEVGDDENFINDEVKNDNE